MVLTFVTLCVHKKGYKSTNNGLCFYRSNFSGRWELDGPNVCAEYTKQSVYYLILLHKYNFVNLVQDYQYFSAMLFNKFQSSHYILIKLFCSRSYPYNGLVFLENCCGPMELL